MRVEEGPHRYRRCNLEVIGDCKAETVGSQHWAVFCWMTLDIKKTGVSEGRGKKSRWKLKKEESCSEFRPTEWRGGYQMTRKAQL